MSFKKGQLSKYPIGSLRELWHLAAPLMLMAFSSYAMLFADRLILSRYSVDAMNASAVAGALYSLFMFSSLSLSLIAEVFVGQYNGSGQFKRIGEPVWQMIWFSLMSVAMFWPAALWLGDIFLSKEYTAIGKPFFKWIMLFGPAVPFVGALSAFYVGRGNTLVITLIVVLGNVSNILLDYLLIFGIDGWIPSMGMTGAALATGISQVIQGVILFSLFIKRKNRRQYGTGDFRLKKKPLLQCLRVGWPNAAAHGVTLASWALFNDMVAGMGREYITALVICQNYFFLFSSISEGMGKGVTAITANLIGAKMLEMIPKLISSALRLHAIFSIVLAIPLIIYSAPFIDMFLDKSLSINEVSVLREMADDALVWMWVTFVFNGVFWIYASQLTAAGDTKFTMYLNMLSSWLFLLLPAYLFIIVLEFPASLSWKLMAVDITMVSIMFFLRYRSGKWREFKIISE